MGLERCVIELMATIIYYGERFGGLPRSFVG